MSEESYEQQARAEMEAWRREVLRPPGPLGRAARGVQVRINRAIPEKVHAAVTAVIERMTRGVLVGADFTAPKPLIGAPLSEREARVRERVEVFRRTAAVEGAVAGAGGWMLAAADFPVLIGIKMKLLFEVAALYGRSGEDFRERLYVLSIFQLAFSSAEHRGRVFEGMEDWDVRAASLPASWEGFDWRAFQQEYRDYIDLAKLAQLLPVVGAPVGLVVNWRLLDRLGATAMNAYRMRWFAGRQG